MIEKLNDLIKKTPSDQELGSKVRALFSQYYDDMLELKKICDIKVMAIGKQGFEAAAKARDREKELIEKINL